MPDVFINRRQLLLSAVESVYGTDRLPQESSSYQAVRLIENMTIDLGQEVIEQTGGLSTLGYSRPYATVRPIGVTFRTFVTGADAGSYAANVKPPLGDLFRGCGMLETFVSSNASGRPEWQYSPVDRVQSQCSHTLIAHIDGYEHRILGAMGNCNMIFVAAAPVIAEFNFRGQLSTEASTLRSTPVLNTATPPRWIGSGSIFVESLGAVIENMNFNTNNKIFEQRASLALSGSGIMKVIITERSPGGSFDPEATNTSSRDWINAWRSTSGAVLYAQVGVTAGNRFSLTGSQAIGKTLSWQDKEGLAVFNMDYQLYERAGRDDYLLRFD